MPEQSDSREYLVLSRGQWDAAASKEEVQAAIDAFYIWYEQSLAAGLMKPGHRLAKEGKVVSKHSVTDGPFAETKEVVGGYWFIVARSLEEAVALAAQNPLWPRPHARGPAYRACSGKRTGAGQRNACTVGRSVRSNDQAQRSGGLRPPARAAELRRWASS